MKDFIVKAGLDVKVIGYDGFLNKRDNALGDITNEIKALVKETGGTYNDEKVA